ncbi:MAG TPA: DsbA family protein [Bacteroidia bacterium]|nr:DsbA family protein [Bacteroidia bacterium]HMU20348.1 DsbA family protein [Bacteroidia bacterium]
MEKNNPLLCNPDSGICEIPVKGQAATESSNIKSEKKHIKVIYYTDPICSSCWGIEPQLRKLKLEYGNIIEMEYRMGGLLPDWSYNSGGISKPSDVAHHWDEVSVYYDMPIDGDIWLEDPLQSSYPPSIAVKAAQLQNHEKALLFLREIREMVFLKKLNITKWENLESAAKSVGLNLNKFKDDYNGRAKELFNEDLTLAKQLGVRGFPTMFFTDTSGKTETVYGSKPYDAFEGAIIKLLPDVQKINYDKSTAAVFSQYQSLTAKEYSVLTGTARSQSEQVLSDLVANGILEKLTTKNGSIWKLKNKGQK